MFRIPDEKIARSNALIVEALYDLALVYKDQMNDEELAIQTFEDLISRYDSSKYHANCYYQLYFIYKNNGNLDKMNYYRSLILEEYPDSDYAKVILNPDYAAESLASEQETQDLYEKAYLHFEQGLYKRAYDMAMTGIKKYPKSEYEPQFQFLVALCLGYIDSEKRMISELEKVASVYGSLEVGQEAQKIIDYFKNDKKLKYTRGFGRRGHG